MFTYDPTLLATMPFMQVRLLIGDTDPNEQLMQDEEIIWELSNESNNIFRAAWRLAENIAAEFSRMADTAIGMRSLQLHASQKSAQYTSLSRRLRLRAAVRGVGIYAGGISVSDKEANDLNTDREPPFFSRELQDFPGTGTDFDSELEDDAPPQ